MGSNDKGDRRERELVNELDNLGFAVMRAPASGAATERDLPDVLAGDGATFYAFEVKARDRDEHIYVDADEIASLEYFAENFGATPLLAIRFDYTDWAFYHPDTVYRTDSGKSYRVRHSDVLGDADDVDIRPVAASLSDLRHGNASANGSNFHDIDID